MSVRNIEFTWNIEAKTYFFDNLKKTFSTLTKVDLPRPDSPTTIRVNSNPRRSDLRYTWLGRLEKPKIKNDIIVSFQVCLQGHVRILYHKPIFPDGLTVLIWSRKLFVPSRFIWVMILENKSAALFLLSCQLVRSAISWFNSELELGQTSRFATNSATDTSLPTFSSLKAKQFVERIGNDCDCHTLKWYWREKW